MAQPKPLASLVSQARVSRRLQIAAIKLLGRQSHYAKRVFCDEKGQVTPDAEKVLALLARETRLNRHGFEGDADRRLFDAGAQHTLRLLIEWIKMDTARLARVEQQLNDDLKG